MVSEPSRHDLEKARGEAIDAQLVADDLEAQARKARRRAAAKMKHYEDMLLIAQGQMTLPYDR